MNSHRGDFVSRGREIQTLRAKYPATYRSKLLWANEQAVSASDLVLTDLHVTIRFVRGVCPSDVVREKALNSQLLDSTATAYPGD